MPNPDGSVLDERIVEMRIDNRQFVDGAEDTISVLDRLKSALSFKNTTRDLDELSSRADAIDFRSMSRGLDAVTERFSALGIAGMRVIQNLTDSVYYFATRTIKDLSIGQITAGWGKYEEMATSVQTIISATRKDIGDKSAGFDFADEAEQIARVNYQMRMLGTFTDETSYSLSDMTSNIGKFTAAGIHLDQAVIDMEGIAVWAGQAGANSAEASRAMYNLSQAISVGSVKLMDWRSIENANMATLEFKETVIQTALEVGTLKKNGNGLITTLHGTTVSAQNFNAALSEGWFSAEVLEKSLTKYGNFANAIGQVSDDTGISVTDLLDALEKFHSGELNFEEWQKKLLGDMGDETPSLNALRTAMELLGDEEMALGESAYRASQEVRTLSDAIKAVKDKVSTGWLDTFSYIFGDPQEQKDIWMDVYDALEGIFASGAERRNSILKLWKEKGGRDNLIESFKNIYAAFGTYIEPIRKAFSKMFSWGDTGSAAKKLLELTKRFKEFTSTIGLSEDAMKGLEVIFNGIFGSIKKGTGIVGNLLSFAGTGVGYLKKFIEIFLSAFKSGKFDKNQFITDINSFASGLSKAFSFLFDIFENVRAKLSNIGNVWTTIGNGLLKAWNFVKNVFTSIKDGLSKIFSSDNFGITNILKIAGGIFLLQKGFWNFRSITGIVHPFLTIIHNFSDLLESLGDSIYKFSRTTPTDDFKKLAISIGILTVALVVLASMDAKKLGIAHGILAGGMAELVGAIGGLNLVTGGKSKKVGKNLVSLAASVLLFAIALRVLSGVDPKSMLYGLGAIMVILGEILAFLELINVLQIKPKAIRGVVSLAVAMLIFTGVIYLMGSIPYEKLKQGLISLSIALAVVSVAMIALAKFGGGKALLAGAGMLFLATSLIILAGAVALFSLIKPEKLGTTLALLGGSLLIIAVAVMMMPATLPLIGIGLMLVAVAIGILAGVLALLTKVDFNSLMESIVIVMVALAGIAVVMGLMSGFIVGALALLVISAAFVVAAGAFIVFALALRLVNGMPLLEIAGGLAAVGGALILLAVGLVAMTLGIIGAVALIVTAAGLLVLGSALSVVLGSDLVSIAGGLTLLGLALIPLGIGGLVLLLGIPGLTAGAIAIGLMGIALIPFAIALKQLEEVSFLTVVEYLLILAGTAGALALLTPILGPLAVAVGAFGLACLGAGEGLNLAGDGMVKIAESIKNIPDNIGRTFKDAALSIGDSVVHFKPNGQKVIDEVNSIGTQMVQQFSVFVPEFNTLGGNVVAGIAKGVYSRSSSAVEAMYYLAQAMIVEFQKNFKINSPSKVGEELAGYIDLGIARGIDNGTYEVVSSIDSLGFKMVDSMTSAMALVSQLASDDMSISPVITPVVDMSAVDQSASSISGLFSTSSAAGRIGGIGSNMKNLENLSANMSALSEAKANNSMDTYEINVYASPGMDEEELADAILDRISSITVRKGAALG